MRKTSAPRRPMAVLLAIAIHGALGMALLSRPEDPAPEEIVMEVALTPPWRPTPRRDEAAKLSPRAAPALSRTRDQASSAVPIASHADKAAPTADWRVRRPSAGEDVRRSLRAGVGCRSADFLALTTAERQACDEKLAAGARDGPVYAVVSPKLKKEFDGVFECPKDDVWCEYRVGKAPYPGLFAPRRRKRTAWD